MGKTAAKKTSVKKKTTTMKPRMPKKMKVGYRHYAIKSVDKDSDFYGACVFERSEIHLREDVGGDEKKSTVFHEYCHAKMHDGGLRDVFTARQEETICQFFSQAVMELIRDPNNWKMILWAKERDKDSLPPFVVAPGPNYPGES
jgi:Zn-dependent peptidase ImmA (M78 family)